MHYTCTIYNRVTNVIVGENFIRRDEWKRTISLESVKMLVLKPFFFKITRNCPLSRVKHVWLVSLINVGSGFLLSLHYRQLFCWAPADLARRPKWRCSWSWWSPSWVSWRLKRLRRSTSLKASKLCCFCIFDISWLVCQHLSNPIDIRMWEIALRQ